MINSVTQTPLGELLSAENRLTYRIPLHQREHSWSTANWEALFDDLTQDGADSGHFVGRIVCINKSTDTLNGVLELIDGQQRMTTLTILMAAVCSALGQLLEDKEDPLDSRAMGADTDVEKLLGVLRRIKNSVLVKLEVANEADAFTTFESLNNGGIPLTPVDLIKNNVLMNVDEHTQRAIEEGCQRWSLLLDDLGDNHADQKRFFRHIYNAFRADIGLDRAPGPCHARQPHHHLHRSGQQRRRGIPHQDRRGC